MYLFILFLIGTFVLYRLTPLRFKWTILLLSSYAFYFVSSGWLVCFMAAGTLSIYLTGLWLQRLDDWFKAKKSDLDKPARKVLKARITRRKKGIAALALFINFGFLFFFKYFNFFGENINAAAGWLGLGAIVPTLKLTMPLGISYYTLQAVSYVIDVYRGKYPADKNLGRVALFISFFPQITEGPIGRYDQLAHQLYKGRRFDYEQFCYGLQLLVWGMFKKLVIADRAALLVGTVFKNYAVYNGLIALASITLFTIQIYMDFSGYMDLITGGAQLLGVRLSPNFARPFFSRSVNEFWRRWHITLGAWLRDYIFYPVTLSKPFMKLSRAAKSHLNAHFGALLPSALALFFVWFGNGIWHGASWKYICYGLYYYVIMLLGMFLKPLTRKIQHAMRIRDGSKVYGAFQMVRTTLLVTFGMLLFRAPTLQAAFSMFASIFRGFSFQAIADRSLFSLGMDKHDFMVVILGVLLVLTVSILQEKGISIRNAVARKPLPLRWAVYLGLIMSVIIFGAYGGIYQNIDPIYAQF